MRLLQKSMKKEISFDENKEVQLDMPVVNLYRRWILTFDIKLKCGAKVPTGKKHNNFLNLIEKVIVYHNGGKTRSSISAVDRYFVDTFKHGVSPVKENLVTPLANNTSTMRHTIIVDFARNKKILSDFSALLDAPSSKSVTLGIKWGSISDIYGTPNDCQVDTSTSCRVSVIEAYDDGVTVDGQPNIVQVRENLVFIKEEVAEFPIDKAYESYDADMLESKILPVNSTMLSQCFFAKNNITDKDPKFADNVIDQFKIQNVEGAGEVIIEDFWHNLVDPTKTDYSLSTLPEGILFVDWLDQRQRGLIISESDALKVRLLTHAPAAGKNNAVRVYNEFVTADT